MDYLQAFAISAAGMTVQRMRLEVASLNLANAHTVQQGTQGYQPLRAVVRPTGFAALLAWDGSLPSLPNVSVEATESRARLVHEPGHPAANEEGFVAYPAIDHAAEMVTLITALRSYEANVAAMNTARALALKALEIGRVS